MSVDTAQPATRPAPAAEPARHKPPKGFDRPRFLKLFTGVFFLVLFAPIAMVILFSFNSSRSLQDFQGFSLRWYEQFFETESLRDSLIASIEIALITMVVATVLGTAAGLRAGAGAHALVRRGQRADADPARHAGDRGRRLRACCSSRRSGSSSRSPRSCSRTSPSRSRT